MEDSITLDRQSFRTLSSKTRVGIIKSLGRRRKMLTELSKEFRMSPSTIKEHMDSLFDAGLVVQIDDGHKWKYYELTSKGREIVSPTGSRIFIVLGISVIAIIATAWDLAKEALSPVSFAVRNAAPAADMLTEAAKDSAGNALQVPVATSLPAALPVYHILAIGVFAAILGISLGYILSRKMDPRVLD